MRRSGMVRTVCGAVASALLLVDPERATAQATGALEGMVTSSEQRTGLSGIIVAIDGTPLTVTTHLDGRFQLRGVPAGRRLIVLRGLGYREVTREVEILAGQTARLDVTLETEPVRLGEMTVEGASRVPERVAEAPAAIAVVERGMAAHLSITGQPPAALATLPGVDVVQSGVDEFNVNARGFNSSLTRRMLVLQDGRDLAVPLLGFQEWTGLSSPLADLWTIEVVRGPGSALYGANAYNGVIDIRTPLARDVVGSKATLAGGELNSLHIDLRSAGATEDGRIGYKVNGGHNRSESWTRSRTAADRGDLRREYAGLAGDAVPLVMETSPLFGQTLEAATRRAIGEPHAVASTYGSGRVDLYRSGWIGTVEAGGALLENTTLVTGIGRIQTDRVLRPWARAEWSREDVNVSAWYSGRSTLDDPHVSLGSGATIVDRSAVFQLEVQGNRRIASDRGRIVAGASARTTRTDTEGTLFPSADDDRSDHFGSVYGQLEWSLLETLEAVGALRYDAGSLYSPQLSPRVALVFTPHQHHAFRATMHRAFQTPTQLEHFLRVPAARPADFTALESGLRASPLGGALANVAPGALFTNSSAVPVLAMGNADLDVESVSSYELGYRGQLGNVFLSVEAFHGRLSRFVTDLLPGANPAYPAWTAPAEVPASARTMLEQTVRSQLATAGQALAAAGLTRLPDGSTAIVVSYANAGRAKENGIEIGARAAVARGLDVLAAYTLFDFDVDPTSVLAGDVVLPNTPRHKGSVSADLRRERIEAGATATFIDAFDWAAGVFTGPVPSRQTLDLRAAFHLLPNVRLQAVATNVLDQKRYQMFGGSLVGRRVVGGIIVAF